MWIMYDLVAKLLNYVGPAYAAVIGVLVLGSAIAGVVRASNQKRREVIASGFARKQEYQVLSPIQKLRSIFGVVDLSNESDLRTFLFGAADFKMIAEQIAYLLTRSSYYTVENILVKQVKGTDYCICDFTSITYGNDSKFLNQIGVVFARLPVQFPRVQLAPANLPLRLESHFHERIEFESHEFNQHYIVDCSDRKMAFQLLNPRVLVLLNRFPLRRRLFFGQFLLTWKDDFYDYLEALRVVEETEEILAAVDGYLMKDLRCDPDWKSLGDATS